MSTPTDTRYIFIVEWHDTAACLVRTYNLTYYTHDKSIDMVIIFFYIYIKIF